MKYLKNMDEYLMEDNFIGRTMVNIFDHAAEILSYFRSTRYSKNKEGLKNALYDWLDNEYFEINDRSTLEPFLDKYIKTVE